MTQLKFIRGAQKLGLQKFVLMIIVSKYTTILELFFFEKKTMPDIFKLALN